MSDAQIIEFYDSHLNITLSELSRMSGKPISYLKKLLLGV